MAIIKKTGIEDLEAKLYMFTLGLKEEKNKEFSFEECERNIAYIFNNYEEFKSYFLENGIDSFDSDIFNSCIMKITKKGTIISLKSLCDLAIKKYKTYISSNKNDNVKRLIKIKK